MAINVTQFLTPILKGFRPKKGGVGGTPTFDPSGDGVLTAPLYDEHRQDIFDNRLTEDSRDLMNRLVNHDPDVSAAVNAYLTVADTEPVIVAYDAEGNIDREAIKVVHAILRNITNRVDYTKKFQLKPALRELCGDLRYWVLLRGGIAGELVVDERLVPTQIRQVDNTTIEWVEKKAGEYKPIQTVGDKEINLDIPSFFVSHYRRNPTDIYTYSPFVSVINTVAARQQVVNDLYRIMRITGFPRVSIQVLEEVLIKNAPSDVREDPQKLKTWVKGKRDEIAASFANLRADQAWVHTDSTEISILNDKNPGAALDVTAIIETLNAQNQAALKTMATILGRGTSGVNTGSVEARMFAMYADAINVPVAAFLSQLLSLALQLTGTPGFVEVKFRKAEMRPELELEPQLSIKSSRLKQDLSLGLISDDEYHLQMYGRLAPEGAPELSGTGFLEQTEVGVDETRVSPNSDPLGRSMSSQDAKSAKSNTNK